MTEGIEILNQGKSEHMVKKKLTTFFGIFEADTVKHVQIKEQRFKK